MKFNLEHNYKPVSSKDELLNNTPCFLDMYFDENSLYKWQEHYEIEIFSFFDKWLTEDEANEKIGRYFERLNSHDRLYLPPNDVELKLINFYEEFLFNTNALRIYENEAYKICSSEISFIALSNIREWQHISLFLPKYQAYLVPFNDLTFCIAWLKGQKTNIDDIATKHGLYKLK